MNSIFDEIYEGIIIRSYFYGFKSQDPFFGAKTTAKIWALITQTYLSANLLLL